MNIGRSLIGVTGEVHPPEPDLPTAEMDGKGIQGKNRKHLTPYITGEERGIHGLLRQCDIMTPPILSVGYVISCHLVNGCAILLILTFLMVVCVRLFV